MKKKKKSFLQKLKESPINYMSDLFICAMVIFWIVDNVWESMVATAVTVSSIIISHQNGFNAYEVTMWSSIGTNVALPLSCGGAIWMIKNGVQHAIANNKGKRAHMDFAKVDVDDVETEQEQTTADSSQEQEGAEG